MVKDAPSLPTASGVLLVVSESQNVAKRIESYLRNAGHPLRAAWVADLEELEDALQRAAPDLLLCAEGLPSAPHKDVIAICARVVPDLPVLLLAESLSFDATTAALASGAREVVSAQEQRFLRHLELVCLRELGAHNHVRELRRVRMTLADFEARHRNLLSGTADAVAHAQEGILSHVNPAFATMLGYDGPADLESQPLMEVICAEHRPKVKDHFKKLLQAKAGEGPFDLCFQHRDGRALGVQAILTRAEQDGEGVIEMLIRAEAASATSAKGGGSSGRAQLFETLQEASAGKHPGNRSLLFIIVDEFHRLEERLGFYDAEQIASTLQELVAQRLGEHEMFRFSSAEFAALVNVVNPEQLEQVAENLRKDVAAQVMKTPSYEAQVTLTVGAYPSRGREERPLQVINEVILETRKLSSQGGNRALVLGPTAKAAQQEKEEQRVAARVKKAIEENRLKLAYQSIASLEGDPRARFDVFVRMIDETGKELMARDFLPSAEKYGLMRAIDRWVVARTLKLIGKRAANENSAFFVRLSEDTMKDAEGFSAWFAEQLGKRPLNKDELVLDVQETILQNHIRKAKTLAKVCTDLNAEIAIDYFGSNANSGPLLEHIPARYVKFHPTFTQQFNDPIKHKRMLELLEIAKQRNAKVIVSHVEDANVMARLWQMGVNYIQGHSVQEPEVVLLAADVTVP